MRGKAKAPPSSPTFFEGIYLQLSEVEEEEEEEKAAAAGTRATASHGNMWLLSHQLLGQALYSPAATRQPPLTTQRSGRIGGSSEQGYGGKRVWESEPGPAGGGKERRGLENQSTWMPFQGKPMHSQQGNNCTSSMQHSCFACRKIHSSIHGSCGIRVSSGQVQPKSLAGDPGQPVDIQY